MSTKGRYTWNMEPVRRFIESQRVKNRAEIMALLQQLDSHGPLNPNRGDVNGWAIRIFPPRPSTWSIVYASKGGAMIALLVFADDGTTDRNAAVAQALPIARQWCV